MVWPSMGGHGTQGAMLGLGRGRVNEGGTDVRHNAGTTDFMDFPSLSPRWYGRGQILSPFSAAFRPLFCHREEMVRLVYPLRRGAVRLCRSTLLEEKLSVVAELEDGFLIEMIVKSL